MNARVLGGPCGGATSASPRAPPPAHQPKRCTAPVSPHGHSMGGGHAWAGGGPGPGPGSAAAAASCPVLCMASSGVTAASAQRCGAVPRYGRPREWGASVPASSAQERMRHRRQSECAAGGSFTNIDGTVAATPDDRAAAAGAPHAAPAIRCSGETYGAAAVKTAGASIGAPGRRDALLAAMVALGGASWVGSAGLATAGPETEAASAPSAAGGGACYTVETSVDASSCATFEYDYRTPAVPQNLKAKEYLAIIGQARPKAIKALNTHIKYRDWRRVGTCLTDRPFSDIRTAALYLPWALMREGEYISAVQCRKAYAALDTQLGDLKQIAEAVDMDGATPEQVVQSFAQLVTVLNNFVGTVPPKYQAEFFSEVPTNLKVKEYHAIITRTRPSVFKDLSTRLKAEDFEAVSRIPFEAPFTDLRTAARCLSWALLQEDAYSDAVAAAKADVQFERYIQDLQKAAKAVLNKQGVPDQVQQNFILLNSSLEALLEAVPSRFKS